MATAKSSNSRLHDGFLYSLWLAPQAWLLRLQTNVCRLNFKVDQRYSPLFDFLKYIFFKKWSRCPPIFNHVLRHVCFWRRSNRTRELRAGPSPSWATLVAWTICNNKKTRGATASSLATHLASQSYNTEPWRLSDLVMNQISLSSQANIWQQKQGDVPVARFFLHHTLRCNSRWGQAEMEVMESGLLHILFPSTRCQVWASVYVRLPDVAALRGKLNTSWHCNATA